MVLDKVFSDKLVKGVKARIGNEPWFRGVCFDGLDDAMTLEQAIDHATTETIYWDSPYLAKPELADLEPATEDR